MTAVREPRIDYLTREVLRNGTKNPDCMIWPFAKVSKGYGNVSVEGRCRSTHIVAYEIVLGEVPIGLELDHLCRVRACFNPRHVEPVTDQENALRGEGPTALNARKTCCPKGHPYDEANTRIHGGSGARVCRTCWP